MQVRQVEYFLAVVDHGNIRRAAAALGLAQPSVSQAIAVLEHELGARLFDRAGPGGVSLSSAGLAFLGPARRLLRTSKLADGHGAAAGLDIVTWGNLALEPTARVVAQLRRETPALTVRLDYADDEESVCDLVRRGHSEIGTIFLPAVVRGLDVHDGGEVELWLILPPGTAAGPDPVPLSAIAHHPLIEVSGGSQNLLVRRTLAEADVPVRLGVVSNHRQALVNLVLAGAGATVAAEVYARQAAARGAVVRRLDPPITRRYGIVYRPDRLSAAARRFIELASTAPVH